eukprot:scaffold2808_cov255-Pinguiococcus_pyrenoidosus.AAC.44
MVPSTQPGSLPSDGLAVPSPVQSRGACGRLLGLWQHRLRDGFANRLRLRLLLLRPAASPTSLQVRQRRRCALLLFLVRFRSDAMCCSRNGPYLEFQGLGIGFWQGKADHEICAAMTGTRAGFWRESEQREECSLLLITRETAFLKTCEALLFLVLLLYIVRNVLLPEVHAVFRQQNRPDGRDQIGKSLRPDRRR